ncbi:P-loop NTPase fold protein [Streptomyces xanthophaeus]
MTGELNTSRAIAESEESLSEYRSLLSRLRTVQRWQQERKGEIDWDWRSSSVVIAFTLLSLTYIGGALTLIVLSIFLMTITCLSIALFTSTPRRTLGNTIALAISYPLEYTLSARLHYRGKTWEAELKRLGVRPLMTLVVQAFLGDDPEELLMTDSYEGLRSSTGRRFIVASEAGEKIERKINQMDGGVIAVCGPRGAGKTTLLESSFGGDDFAVFASAPASFTPHDFLLSLFIELCEAYIIKEGGEVPDLVRLNPVKRALLRTLPKVSKSASWLTYAVLACLLIGLGSFATVRTLKQQHADNVYEMVGNHLENTGSFIVEVWRGENLGAGLGLAILGVLIWRARHTGVIGNSLKAIHALAVVALTAALFLIPLYTFTHGDSIDQIDGFFNETYTAFGMGALAFCYSLTPKHPAGEWRRSRLRLPKRVAYRVARVSLLAAIIILAYQSASVRAIASNPDNSVRALSILTAALVFKLGLRERRSTGNGLVLECRKNLIRLQTTQTSSVALNAGVTQLLGLGGLHTASMSTVPPNFPALINDFRTLLASIASSNFLRNERTFVCIDELDRLGSDVQALAFLGEIKAIFGVPRVHYLLSVADDVGASFMRRGMAARDVADSSLDDIVYVQPCTLPLSEKILLKRAPGISTPYIALAHALSGGLPRDLVRYGRRIIEIEAAAGSSELTDISRRLVLEELSEALSACRVLLSKHRWNEDASAILESFRSLVALLRYEYVPVSNIRRALEDFAAMRYPIVASSESAQISEELAHLIAEASTYAYFSLTLLDIFSSEGFTRRSEVAANRGPEGTPQLLAEARQELVVSPHTARRLLKSIRQAWGLEVATTNTFPHQAN